MKNIEEGKYIIHRTNLSEIIKGEQDEKFNSFISNGYSIIYQESIETNEGIFIYFYFMKGGGRNRWNPAVYTASVLIVVFILVLLFKF